MKLSRSVYKSFESLCLQGYILEQELKIAITGSLFWCEIQIKEKAAQVDGKDIIIRRITDRKRISIQLVMLILSTNANPWYPLWCRLYWRNISF